MKTPTINSRILKLEVLKGTGPRTSVNAVESRTTSLESDVATAQGDISTLQTDVSAAEGNISTLQGDVATLTQGIQDAVSTHNTATDSHADIRATIAEKQDALTISPAGASLLSIVTPSSAKLPLINPDGSATLINVPGGGGSYELSASSAVQVWFDTTSIPQGISGQVSSDGQAVLSWRDQSVHGYHASQQGAAPTWESNQINGRGALHFATGTDQRLLSRPRFYQAGLVGDFTIFCVCRRAAASGAALYFGSTSTPRLSMYTYNDGSGEDWRVLAGDSPATATDYTPGSSWELLEVRYRAGSTYFYINGSLLQTVSGTLTHTVTAGEQDWYIGSYTTSGVDVYLAAVVVLDGTATSILCDSVRAHLRDLYAL